MKELLESLLANKLIKAFGSILAVLVAEGFSWLPSRMLVTLVFFMLLDTGFGAGVAIWRKQFSSMGLRRGLGKLGLYYAILLVVHLLVKAYSNFPLISQLEIWTQGYLVLTEAISILEKVGEISISTGYKLPVIDLLLKRLSVMRDR